MLALRTIDMAHVDFVLTIQPGLGMMLFRRGANPPRTRRMNMATKNYHMDSIFDSIFAIYGKGIGPVSRVTLNSALNDVRELHRRGKTDLGIIVRRGDRIAQLRIDMWELGFEDDYDRVCNALNKMLRAKRSK
jgi:hypothetical protein